MRERFNTVAVAIPAQQFLIRCHVSVERQVPVMTEFAVRLLHLAGSLGVESLGAYFGLKGKEVNDLLDLLRVEGLIEEVDGKLTLTSYAEARFVSSGDGLPRFHRIAERQSRPVFELLTFSPIPKVLSGSYWDNTLDLAWDASGERNNRTVDQAQEAFHRHFHDIERQDRDDEQRRAFDVYKIDDITAGRRFNIPLPVHFDVDLDGNVEFDIESQLALLPEELRSTVYKLTAERIARQPQHADHFSEFVNVFNDDVLARYLDGVPDALPVSMSSTHVLREDTPRIMRRSNAKRHFVVANPQSSAKFDFASYVREVHGSANGLEYDAGKSRALLGALYMPKNQERFVELFRRSLHRFKANSSASTVFPKEMFWVVPDSDLWGRTESLRSLIEQLMNVTAKEWGEPIDLVAVCSGAQSEPMERLRWRANLLLDAGFSDVLLGPSLATSGRFEVLLLPGVAATALYHWKIPTSDVISVPLGFYSEEEDKLGKLLVFLKKVCEMKLHRIFRGSGKDGEDRKLKVEDASPTDFMYFSQFLNSSGKFSA
ncbi:hypothetical protein EV700_1540 [Fluviicoccus keumensis]|uniref:Uncharacterized protein n=1 Tax=Fluviicoccus keumensis TaxID=1435465 RepID=A0A4Q7Z9D0_9GAMM|nr:hypothetical protein [Fluviicoccus keumensis]RZU47147.1 hypothetical protein EV700_1540 [Fluviicoccus keumensis]